MTTAGVLLGMVIGVVLLAWVVNLVRRDRLYVGYGVIFVFGTLVAMTILIVPPLLGAVTRASVTLLPVPSLLIVALVIFMFLMVYVFTQITVLSNRVMRLTQELAIRNAEPEGDAAARAAKHP